LQDLIAGGVSPVAGDSGAAGRGRALLGHRRRPARCELCRSAGNVSQRAGVGALLETCKRCFASLFTDRAISYRVDKGFDHFKVALSIGVQRMVRSDLACSGVMFTIDTETGFRDAVLISAAYGLGENVVQGSVTPDEYTSSSSPR
jgi:hypothetical protein